MKRTTSFIRAEIIYWPCMNSFASFTTAYTSRLAEISNFTLILSASMKAANSFADPLIRVSGKRSAFHPRNVIETHEAHGRFPSRCDRQQANKSYLTAPCPSNSRHEDPSQVLGGKGQRIGPRTWSAWLAAHLNSRAC